MDLTFRIRQTSNYIFDHLTDMQKFASVHPVITQIDNTGNDSYLVFETLTFGFIRFPFTYPMTTSNNQLEKTVLMRATVMKLIHAEMRFVLKPENDFTVIKETINFKSPLPITSIMQRVFTKQHNQLFKNIELATR